MSALARILWLAGAACFALACFLILIAALQHPDLIRTPSQADLSPSQAAGPSAPVADGPATLSAVSPAPAPLEGVLAGSRTTAIYFGSGALAYVNGVLIPDTCPPGIANTQDNVTVREGETKDEMLERNKRDAIAEYNRPCERDFSRRLNAAMAAGNPAMEAAIQARGHEYSKSYGEAYNYAGLPENSGYLILRQGGGQVIFVMVWAIPGAEGYTVGQPEEYLNCNTTNGNCSEFVSRFGESIPFRIPSSWSPEAAVVRDAGAGKLQVFSNAAKLLASTPW